MLFQMFSFYFNNEIDMWHYIDYLLNPIFNQQFLLISTFWLNLILWRKTAPESTFRKFSFCEMKCGSNFTVPTNISIRKKIWKIISLLQVWRKYHFLLLSPFPGDLGQMKMAQTEEISLRLNIMKSSWQLG